MNIPKHIAIIMDGNGRWAKKRLLPPIAGHKKGVSAVRKTVKQCATLGVEVLTLFAFSSENKNRPQTEITALFSLFLIALKKEIKKLDKANIQFKVIGDLSIFDDELIQMIKQSEKQLDKNTGLTLVIAANYGGKWDIVQATKKIAKDINLKRITIDNINETLFDSKMSLNMLPPVDLLIRTSGEQRISNFLLWECAYSEFYFTQTLWPAFNEENINEAIAVFNKRQRRFGAR
jgi:undecaprenyl diphosphate synthase